MCVYISEKAEPILGRPMSQDLGHQSCNNVITDVKIRIINVYRSFRPPNFMTPEGFFVEQLKVIKNASCTNCYVIGDFNLDAKMSYRNDYHRKIPLKLLNDFAAENNYVQIVDFYTWSRNIKGIRKESLLDHVYVNNNAAVTNVSFVTPTFGDHVLILVDITVKTHVNTDSFQKRNWNSYSPLELNTLITLALTTITVTCDNLNVQDHWNLLELAILDGVESCAPLSYAKLGHTGKELSIPSSIKNKLNVRKILLKLDRERSVTVNAHHIRTLNKEINSYFGNARASRVRLAAMGSKVNLWKAVKVAKNLNLDSIPPNLTLGGFQ